MFHHGRLTSQQDIKDRCHIHDTVDGRKRYQIFCDSNSESMEAYGTFQNPAWKSDRTSTSSKHGRGWFGTDSYGEAITLLREGWPEGTAKMRQLAMRLAPSLPTGQRIRMRYHSSVAPHGMMMVDPAALQMGSPAPFIGRFTQKDKTAGNKIIKIGINLAVSGGVSSDVIEGKGAAVLALIDTLQKLRKEVDVTILSCSRVGQDKWTPAGGHVFLGHWHVKPAGSRMNVDQLAFALINPSANRRFMFAMMEQLPAGVCESEYNSYGMPSAVKTYFPEVAAKFDVFVDSDVYRNLDTFKAKTEWTSVNGQVEWIKAELRRQGVEC